jgi:hypothetical protein
MARMAVKKPWLTWTFVAQNLTKGGLSAIGSIVVYVMVLWFVVSKWVKNSESSILTRALAMRAPGLAYGGKRVDAGQGGTGGTA